MSTTNVAPAAEPAVAPTAKPAFDQSTFRNVAGSFASGVTVITTAVDGELFGTTASAVSSLSMDPASMLMCLNRASSTHDAVVEAGVFAINILAEHQGDLAMKFGRKGPDKFAGTSYTLAEHGGVPLLDGAVATVVCEVFATPVGGTHTVFFGKVLEAVSNPVEPLAYFRGKFGRFEQANEQAAYQAVREWVLTRRTPLGEALVPEAIGEELRLQSDDVYNALIKLGNEQLVDRDVQGVFTARPITADFIDGVYDARATIEIGVLATHVGKISDADVEELQAMTERLGELRGAGEDGLDEFLRLNAKYHDRLVKIAGSTQLQESYRRLGIGTVWRQALTPADWGSQLDHSHIATLTDALARRDAAGAIAALQAHTEFAKSLARAVIERHGGTV